MPTSRQYTIRGIPLDADRALRKQARERNLSLNQFLVGELIAAAHPDSSRRYRSLAGVARKWVDDPEFDKVLEE